MLRQRQRARVQSRAASASLLLGDCQPVPVVTAVQASKWAGTAHAGWLAERVDTDKAGMHLG